VRRSKAARYAAAGIALLLVAAATPVAAAVAATTPGDLDAARRECIAAARDTQQREQAVLTLDREIGLLGHDADARQRGLDESRAEQQRVLGTLAHVARHPAPDRTVLADTPLDRRRGEMLIEAAEPALRAQGHALAGEIRRIAVLRQRVAAKQVEVEAARRALATERERLTGLTARRRELTRQLLPEDPGAAARIARLARDAKGLGDLAKNADAATDRRDKELLARARPAVSPGAPRKANTPAPETVDPTRPSQLRALTDPAGANPAGANPAGDAPQAPLVMPVAGTIGRHFGEMGPPGAAIEGLSLTALARAAVVAPFDGRVVYAGPFRDFGLVLIIRHTDGYHSALAGLDRVDAAIDQWVLAGEPVGAMPGAPLPSPPAPAGASGASGSGGTLYVELRRDGRPVDPQPWLATRDEGRDEPTR
jgi:septal ring factor EnvC (AmiA/AmiB activator)